MKRTFLKIFLLWLPFAALVTFVCLLGYALVQQDLRQTANDPQEQIVQDISAALSSGNATPQEIAPPGQTVDISTSLDPYVIVVDSTGTVLSSSAVLGGRFPVVPDGVFKDVLQHGEDRFTWQPQVGVRSAVVVDAWNSGTASGFVIVGRSIREIEMREDNVLHLAEIAWLVGLLAMLAVVWIVVWAYEKKTNGQ